MRAGLLLLMQATPVVHFLASTPRTLFTIRNNRWKCSVAASCGYSESVKRRTQYVYVEDRDREVIAWWQEKMRMCKKPTTLEMIKAIVPTNLLGLDPNLRNGSLKDGTLNSELLEVKRKFPHEVILCRVGDFYEACGFDACILVELAGLNPMGGMRSKFTPRAGCPLANLRQTIEDVTKSGLSVCVVEEVQGAFQSKTRKDRFVAGHAHPGSPYVYGLAESGSEIDFPEPCPVVGISHSARGYCLLSFVEMMRTYTVEDALTEEALVTKLRAVQYQRLFLHRSLREAGKWGPSGGILWGECKSKSVEWFDHEPVSYLLEKVKEMYDIDDSIEFREIVRPLAGRPRPIYMGTASQIGILPVPGIPSLLKVLIPSDCSALCVRYFRDLLLNPPPYATAASIQESIKMMTGLKCPVPDFICVPAAKLVKLIGAREVNYLEFVRLKNIAEDVLHMYHNEELKCVFQLLLEPTVLATGLRIEAEQLVSDCTELVNKVCNVVAASSDCEQAITGSQHIPDDFFTDMESDWRGRVQRRHAEEVYADVDRTAQELISAVADDFHPIVVRTKSLVQSSFGKAKGEICYARDHQSIWFKGRGFKPHFGGGDTLGEEQMKRLKPALDSKGRKVGDEWHTTERVEKALASYREAVFKANAGVLAVLRDLANDIMRFLNTIIFISTLCVIAKALFAHASEGKRRRWVVPDLVKQKEPLVFSNLLPYWLDATQDLTVPNSFEMSSIFLLTGPNGGGKSSLLRSLCAATLLGTCGLMVPASKAGIPQFDSIMLRMSSSDSPSEGKSLFQMEMADLKTILLEATQGSLILVDELCKGTDVQKGTCILASVLEKLDRLGCYGIVSTHLHGLLDMELDIRNVIRKCMGAKLVDDHLEPTWELGDGECRESLAFETAKGEGVTDEILLRASQLYKKSQEKQDGLTSINGLHALETGKRAPSPVADMTSSVNGICLKGAKCLKDVEHTFLSICSRNSLSGVCHFVGPRQQPPPFTSNQSCVYILQRPDGKFYVGQTDNLAGRIAAHRSSPGLKHVPFIYLPVSNKSVACQLETTLISRLSLMGLNLLNKVDQKHKHFGVSQAEAPF